LSGFHLAGIVPVAGQPLDFNMPWHDCLMPIGQDYLAVERAVLECAYAGCETIWVVCNDDMQPLIRYRLGEYINDPVWTHRHFEYNKKAHQKRISIHYVPIHPRDRKKRDCLGWSVLHGAWTANKISGGLSTWLKPNRFYVAFPYGVYDHWAPRDYRREISTNKQFFFSYNNKTIVDGEYLGFTFDLEDYKKLISEVKAKSTGIYRDEERKERLSVDERFSYRFFKLEEIFDTLSINNSAIKELPRYNRIDSWESYCNYISEKGAECKGIPRSVLSYKEWNKIGFDD
jgi:hypothetical protein